MTANKPDCMTQREWEDYFRLWCDSESRYAPTNSVLSALTDICDDCELPYQLAMMLVGKCHPVDPMRTPYARECIDTLGDPKGPGSVGPSTQAREAYNVE